MTRTTSRSALGRSLAALAPLLLAPAALASPTLGVGAGTAPVPMAAPGAELPGPRPVDDDRVVHLDGRRLAVEDLPDTVTEVGRETITAWAAWCAAGDGRYGLTLDDSARVLLVARKTGRKLRSELKLVAEVLAWADARFPAPSADEADPDLPASSRTEGYTGDPLPEHLPVLVLADGDGDLASVLDHLASVAPHLAGWLPTAKTQAGFVLPMPLAAAYLTQGRKLEEWSPEHELLNRLTRLLLVQREGQVPEWLSQGLAWEMEWEHGGGIWSYARREGFVYAAEHDSWDDRLRRAFSDRKGEALPADELCALSKEGFDADAALVAWGAAAFLARHHADALPEVLRRLAEDRRAGARKDLGNGRWVLVPDYATPPETQAEILREVLGDDVLERMVEFFVKGKSYRP